MLTTGRMRSVMPRRQRQMSDVRWPPGGSLVVRAGLSVFITHITFTTTLFTITFTKTPCHQCHPQAVGLNETDYR